MSEPRKLPTELPFVAHDFFFYAFTRGGKWLFEIYLSLLTIGLVGMLYFTHQPYGYSVELAMEGEVFNELLTVEKAEVNARTQTLDFPVYSTWQRFYAIPGFTPVWVLVVFGLFQVLGWAGLMAVTSRLKGAWPYVLYGGMVFYLVLMDIPGLWGIEGGAGWLIILPTVALFLVPAFLIQRRTWVLSVPLQVVLYATLLGALLITAYATGGAPGLHQAVAYPIPALALPWFIFLIHTSKDGVNLILLVSTNWQLKARRVGLQGIIILLFLWLLTVGFVAWRTFDYQLTGPDFTLRPLHLFTLLAVLTVFTSQNYYHQIKEKLTSNLAFCLLLLSAGLLTVGLVFFAAATGDKLFLVRTEWIFAFFLVTVSVVYTLYLLGHFWQSLNSRLNLYFVLMEPPYPTSMRFLVVWFIACALFLFLEGAKKWPTLTIIRAEGYSQHGENARYRGNNKQTVRYFREVVRSSQRDPRVNFLLGTLLENDPTATRTEIADCFRNAEMVVPFPAARLNHVRHLLNTQFDTLAALHAAQHQLLRWPDAEALHNLAAIYRMQHRRDSTLYYQKQAVALAPSNPIMLTTLAQDYWYLGQTEAVTWFYKLSLNRPENFPAFVQQQQFTRLVLDLKAHIPQAPDHVLADSTLTPDQRYNFALVAFLERNAADFWTAFPTQNDLWARSDFMLLGMLGDFLRDSLDLAESRHRLFATTQSPFTGIASNTLAYLYFAAASPEMAAKYYFQAAPRGWPQDSLHGGEMLFDAGMLGEAAEVFNDVVAADSTPTAFPAHRELAYTFLALGQDSIATRIWDFGNADRTALLRTAEQALAWGNFTTGQDLYKALLALDSTSVPVYQSLGRAYRTLDPAKALEWVETGLHYAPTDTELRLQALWLLANLGELARADSLYALLTAAERSDWRADVARIPLVRAGGDSTATQAHMEAVYARGWYRTEALLSVLAYDWQRQRYAEGLDRLHNFLRINDRNPLIWRQVARFAERTGQIGYAQEAARQAIALTASPKAKEKLEQEFQQLLARAPVKANTPGNVLELRLRPNR